MAIKIKQGDAYRIPVSVSVGDKLLSIDDVSAVEFMLGNVRKLYPGEVEFDAATNMFNIPLTQSESFAFPIGGLSLDIRVKFVGGEVQGLERPIGIPVVDAAREAVI